MLSTNINQQYIQAAVMIMQTLITLGIAFSLLATYCESSVQAVASHSYSGKVVRSAPLLPTSSDPQLIEQISSNIIETTEQVETFQPLNLTVPAVKTFHRFYQPTKKSILKLAKRSAKPQITYNAELVYDLEKGEDITGGKVNIKIPFG
jgi:hypothetical protein